MGSIEQERRRHPRISCSLPVRVRRMEDPAATVSADNRREFTSMAVNLSQGGLYIHSQEPLGYNELYRLSINLPETDAKITAFAEVIWSNDKGGGVHFLAIHEDQEIHLREYVHSCLG